MDFSFILLHVGTEWTAHLSWYIQGLNGLFIYLGAYKD